MCGGIVIETIVLPDRVWINTRGRHGARTCAIYVTNTAKARCVSEGDVCWWQGPLALWTPACNRKKTCGRVGIDYDIRLVRIGFSGASRPEIEIAAQWP